MKVLVTGGLGFIGSNLIRLILEERPEWSVVNLDLETYAANPENLAGIHDESYAVGGRYAFLKGDVADRSLVSTLFGEERFDAVIHCAAETHVDRSITAGDADDEGAGAFLRTNVRGTLTLLEASLAFGADRFLMMSTDEVYGSLGPGDPAFTETTQLDPRSPYSASKAAADHMALAFHHTHDLGVVVTRCSNNYGPYQHPEKLIPLMITSALRGRPLPVYGDGKQRRDWIHVEDHCRGVLAALERGGVGEVYNFGGAAERENIDVVRQVIELAGADASLITYVTDRPGHDRRYAMAFDKAERDLDWRPRRTFEEGLADTVAWYRDHEDWWSETADAAYAASRRRIEAWREADAPS